MFSSAKTWALTALLFAAPAWAGTQSITTEDGVALQLTDYGQGAQGVLLVHAEGGSASEWATIADKMQGVGLKVAAIDLRGHGAGKKALTEEEYLLMVKDVAAGVQWLRGHGASEVTVIGAGLGANAALNAAAAADSGIGSLVLISARPNIHGLKVMAAADAFAGKAMTVGSKAIDLEVRTAEALQGKVKGQKHSILLEINASGVQLLERDPALIGTLITWSKGTFAPEVHAEGPAQVQINVNGASPVSATGKKLGEE